MTRRRRCIAALLLLAAAVAGHAEPLRKRAPAPAVERPATRGTLVVGSLTLQACGIAWCGSVQRALDPAGELPGTIAIAFEWHPQRDASLANAGTVVAAEGGPGYPSSASRYGYIGLFEPLLPSRNLLLVDNRGTGRSGALECPALQRDASYGAASVAACGAQLGVRAALYGTALAADDMAAVLDALQLPRVDVYGDSYGTFFAQAFAARHPQRLRSLTLDGAYAVAGADPWYPEMAPAARFAFDAVCQRQPACAALPDATMDRIRTLLAALRERPVTGTAPDGDGVQRRVMADARGLAYVMFSNASGPLAYRELDAAARAWGDGDTAPLLRLIAENQTTAASAGGSPRAFSAALFAAVSCADYPQVFDATAAPAQRRRQADAAIAAQDPQTFAPFAIDEFLSLPRDYGVVELCLPWPAPGAAHPPGQPVPPGTAFPATLPVLVLSGELDSLTPPAQGAQAAALFGNARQVVVANSFHVTAIADADGCASALVRRFVAALDAGDVSCAAAVPAWPLLPAFARRASDLPPPTPGAGNQASSAELQRAAAAVQAAADGLARWWVNFDGSGVGLRGGSFTWRSAGWTTAFALDAMRWTGDVAASGSLVWNAIDNRVLAQLSFDDGNGTLQARWSARGSGGIATLDGSVGGRRLVATMAAP